jgi:hypothetical protein
MTRIVTYRHRPPGKRPAEVTKTAPIRQPIVVVASEPRKRVRPPEDDADSEVSDSVKEFFKRMMKPP